jgi:hypothetical protein
MKIATASQTSLLTIVLGGGLFGCSLGVGQGEVSSDRLQAKECWDAAYDLGPDFFAAVPDREETLQIRVQRGNDLAEVSDGLSILVDDVPKVRTELLNKALCVSLPAGVAPPGTPIGATVDAGVETSDGGLSGGSEAAQVIECDKPLIHMSLYLQSSCHNQNIVLYAVAGNITFEHLFSGDPNEDSGSEKFTKAKFDIEVGDPRDVDLGEPVEALPAEKRSRVTGFFSFYFERGQPGQPFP